MVLDLKELGAEIECEITQRMDHRHLTMKFPN
jgi:6-pyruvoyl-tetrahydropterin synthase